MELIKKIFYPFKNKNSLHIENILNALNKIFYIFFSTKKNIYIPGKWNKMFFKTKFGVLYQFDEICSKMNSACSTHFF